MYKIKYYPGNNNSYGIFKCFETSDFIKELKRLHKNKWKYEIIQLSN